MGDERSSSGSADVVAALVKRLEQYEIRFLAGDQHDRELANDLGRAAHFLGLAQAEPVPVEILLNRVAALICDTTCGLTSECKSREAAQALLDKGYLDLAYGAPLPNRERMAEILYTAAHKGLRNCWKWSDAELDHEHPTSRSYWYKIADGALSALSPTHLPKIVGRVTGKEYDGHQVAGMPGAICHACGLNNYPCVNPDCPHKASKVTSTEHS